MAGTFGRIARQVNVNSSRLPARNTPLPSPEMQPARNVLLVTNEHALAQPFAEIQSGTGRFPDHTGSAC